MPQKSTSQPSGGTAEDTFEVIWGHEVTALEALQETLWIQ